MLIKIHPVSPNPREINKIAEIMANGGIVAYPTDTVYGFGCDIKNNKAIDKLARLKGLNLRKANLSILCHDMGNLSDYTRGLEKHVFKLLKRNLPGPFTFILPASHNVTRIFDSNRKTIGFRIPDNAIILAIIKQLGNPVLNTSARDDDEVLQYMTDPEAIHEKYHGLVDAVVDGGSGGNMGSTIVDCTSWPYLVTREGKGQIQE